jgi:hypothetical protein
MTTIPNDEIKLKQATVTMPDGSQQTVFVEENLSEKPWISRLTIVGLVASILSTALIAYVTFKNIKK